MRQLALAALLFGGLGIATANATIQEGEAFVTCFPGVVSGGIDVNAPVGGVMDFRNPGQPPTSLNWNAPKSLPVTAQEVGLVFGIAIDHQNPPNIYLANSSAFGLHIVDSGGDPISDGASGAQWMPGQFGPDGEPAIYKVPSDGSPITRFGTLTNDGPGFGNIAFNNYTGSDFYVSDLSDGKIYHLDVNGTPIASLDHGLDHAGVADPGVIADISQSTFTSQVSGNLNFLSSNSNSVIAKWGVTPRSRLVWGLGVWKRPSENHPRLYYGVAAQSPSSSPTVVTPAIYSIPLINGAFAPASDITLELDVLAWQGQLISDIAFAQDGRMLVSERGGMKSTFLPSLVAGFGQPFANSHGSRVMPFEWDGSAWVSTLPPITPPTPLSPFYKLGAYTNERNGSGGVDFQYGLDSISFESELESCDARFVATGDRLQNGPTDFIFGVQNSPLANTSAVLTSSYFTDLDNNVSNSEASKTENGDIEVFRRACQVSLPPPIPLCTIDVAAASCIGPDHVIEVTMTNDSAFTPNDLILTFPGLSAGQASYTTDIGNPQSTATITVEGSFSGPLDIEALLTSPADAEGISLWCRRENNVVLTACPSPDCLDFDGVWKDEGYVFTVTDTSNAPNFDPTEVVFMGLPDGAVVTPEPLDFTNGLAGGVIKFPPGTIAAGTEFTFSVNSTGDDLCCSVPVTLTYPGDCEPKFEIEKTCQVHKRIRCDINISDARECIGTYDLSVFDEFDLNAGANPQIIGGSVTGPWSFSSPDTFSASGVMLPQSFKFEADFQGLPEGKNCVKLVIDEDSVADHCTAIP